VADPDSIDDVVETAKSIFEEGKAYEREGDRKNAFHSYKNSFYILSQLFTKPLSGFYLNDEAKKHVPLALKITANALTSYDGNNTETELADLISKYNYLAIEFLKTMNVQFKETKEPYLFFKNLLEIYKDIYFDLKWSAKEFQRWPDGVKNEEIEYRFNKIFQSNRVINDPKSFKY